MLSKVIHWSGIASIIGGLLFAVAVALHPQRDGISIYNSGVFYGAIHNIGVYGLMFQLFGLVGLYISQAEAMGQRGLLAFMVVFFGHVLYTCLLVVDGLRNPLLARFAPQIVHTTADSDPNQLVIVLPALLLFALGYILFGLDLFRAKTQPHPGGLLLAIGAPVYIIGGINIFILGPASPLVQLIEIVGAIPFGLGHILLGYKLRSGVKAPVPCDNSFNERTST